MTTVIDLTPEEVAELKALTHQSDVASAIRTAMTEYLQYARRQQLKAMSGRVEVADNWEELEQRELLESNETHGLGPG